VELDEGVFSEVRRGIMNHDLHVDLAPHRLSRHISLSALQAIQVKAKARVDTSHPAA
jgi:hypothetical protein